ncbi:radical SAM protein [Candidatus Pelagibacter ubique]|nr:radical SAM protein [Candidatus Pelagibacter ubique]
MNSKKPLNIMFGDFGYFNRHTKFSRYTPLGVGYIAQYAKQKFGKDVDVAIYKEIDKFFEKMKERAPDVVGLTLFYWNNDLNKYVIKCLREMFGDKVTIVMGGPSIDSDKKQQTMFLNKAFPDVDAIVINEGEIAFSNIVEKILSNRNTVYDEPIDGLSFLSNGELVSGKPIGTSTDISVLESPYLSGIMDDFMHSDYQPLVQTSRFCPYTCAFCVSGKNRGKLRGFPIEQVTEELHYISKKYADRPHHTLYLADENFGILKRDVEIAKVIKECNEKYSYPQGVFFYNDKRFTETSRNVIEVLGKMTKTGLTLSLQTENPETLKAINRKNVSDDEIDDALNWASELNIPTTTELIFGLPFETKKSFIDLLDRSTKRGFDSIMCHVLFIMDGIELNRPDVREKFTINTKFRPLAAGYMSHNGTFIAEHEEVVVSSKTFSYEDFISVRCLNFMFFSVFDLGFQKWFFQHIKNSSDVTLSSIFDKFMNPDRNQKWPKEYLKFVDDFRKAVEGELFDTREEMVAALKKIYEENGNDVGETTRINIDYGARLIYKEQKWMGEVLAQHLKDIGGDNITQEDIDLGKSLVELGSLERIDFKKIDKTEELVLSHDILEWKRNKFKKPIDHYKVDQRPIKFKMDERRTKQINCLLENSSNQINSDFYTVALDMVQPRSNLLYILSYN